MRTYFDEIEELAHKAKHTIGMDIFAKSARGRVPSQVSGEFITNREQGDWAEALLLKLINEKCKGLKAISYGRIDNLVAGDLGFKEHFEKYQKELTEIGKCPDLLVFKEEDFLDIIQKEISSAKPRKDIIETTKKALAGIEARSSAFLSKKYGDYRKSKQSDQRGFLSFTPKVEDLAVILKWIETHKVPHFYVQVLFDTMYIIPFKKILEILSEPKNNKVKFFIEKNYKNRFKSTIHINLNEGVCLSEDIKQPKHISVRKELVNGRLVHYVKFEISELPSDFNTTSLKKVLGV